MAEQCRKCYGYFCQCATPQPAGLTPAMLSEEDKLMVRRAWVAADNVQLLARQAPGWEGRVAYYQELKEWADRLLAALEKEAT